VKVSSAERVLAVSLFVYIVCDILLTPPAHLETRNPANVTVLGIVALVLLFIGLILGIIAFVLLFRRSSRSSVFAIVAAVLYFPAALSELTGLFSSLKAPAAIAWLELVQSVVALTVIGASFWVRRGLAAKQE
jgi:hypothetical protein